MKRTLVIALATLTFLLWVVNSSLAQQSALVNAKWLADKLGDESVRVIDLAHRVKNYNRGHIPGAVFVNWQSDIIDSEQSESYRMPSQAQFEALMSRIGVHPKTTLVLTDNMDNRAAVRMYLTLKYFGHENVHVLNGGTNAWKAEGLDVSSEMPEYKTTDYKVAKIEQRYLVSLQKVREAVENEFSLLDGRPNNQYTGDAPGKAFHTGQAHRRRGHITTAINIPWASNLNDDGKFKSVEELKQMYLEQGVANDSNVVTYCNEGLHAAMPWFVLHELLQYPGVRVYDDSLVQWANRDDTPMQTGDK